MDEVKVVDMIDLPSDSRRPMRMRMNPDERFHMNASKEKKFAPERYPNLFMAVSTDLSRMDFYADYPADDFADDFLFGNHRIYRRVQGVQ